MGEQVNSNETKCSRDNPQAEMLRQDALCSTGTKRKHDEQDRALTPTSFDDNPQAETMRQVPRCPTDSIGDDKDCA